MSGYILGRVLQALIVIAAVVFIAFGMMFLSGDPVLLLLPPDVSAQDVEEFRVRMGFDRPFLVQFMDFAVNLMQGDFGESWRYQQPALPIILERLPATIELAFTALAISLVLAIPVGIISAVKRDTMFDGVTMVVALIGQSIPSFWLGIMLILFFAVHLQLLPTSGRQGWEYIILPATTLGLALVGRNARLIRSSMLEVLGEDYIRTARAKGLREWVVIIKHALKNAMLPVVTVLGLELGSLLGGTIITESVFGWPGIGLLAIQAVGGRDFPIVQGVIIISAVVFVLINLLVDLFYTWLDPRISLVKQ